MTKPINKAAFLTTEKAYPLEVGEAPYPTPVNDEVIVKAAAIAINPVDWIVQSTAFIPVPYPWILGRDVAGPVVALGPAAPPSLRLGAPVAGLALGFATKDPATSAFQTYVKLSPPLIIAPLPPHVSFIDAAVLPLGAATAAAGLFGSDFLGLRLPPPSPPSPPSPSREAEREKEEVVVVWGASSSVGASAVQLATAAGFAVLATASPAHFALARDLGAREVFDYRDENVADEIVRATEGRRVVGVFDAVGTGGAVEACVEVAGRVVAAAQQAGGGDGERMREKKTSIIRVSTVRPLPPSLSSANSDSPLPPGVSCAVVMATGIRKTAVGPAVFEDFLPKALADGRYKCAPRPVVVGEGLGCLQEGIDRLKGGGVSAEKLVVVMPEEEGEGVKQE
ncbi:Zinc-binding alcohol dehydrogenase domain-containing protein cipB [Diplodia seriata]|uniref:Zinc-binding alcohol dehydrogenase domain-containing protein cipB n=1 Tax=Diplodia seriata TaxID=420778 RepID=A0A1S8BLB6_9PEZI|nr:Zinc-binding alcohol dehydrogenase domain-containing protein cipB [Diplodia seriata]